MCTVYMVWAVVEVVVDMVRGIADARSRIRQGRKGFVPLIEGIREPGR